MKIYQLIEILSAHNPDGEVLGTEHLHISSPLLSGVRTKPLRNYLKGKRRDEALEMKGTALEVAQHFGVSADYILELRKKGGQGA